ncbi:hypothetical protein BDB00DRAFT_945510 [Zychaea mexicana]|uniref:uncharacterized protein n=1 Tax=Zychaea mexicana TaxID=64656 RepID=UPI0022FDBA97|nr:uncharacterized protein BDB00DRAFT_945510 [Zychaea mexicana]KAI9495165.1 hypothetical protein BDB00DRAFT_945510 [Zychaea mexicana]
MNVLYELFCMGSAPSISEREIKGANFQQLLSKTMPSAKHIINDDELKQVATARMKSVVGGKSHSASNTLRTVASMFEAASSAAEFDRERCMLEWLQTCVTTAVEMAFAEADGKPIKPTTGTKQPDPEESFVVEERGLTYDKIGASDDDYVPSDEDAIVPAAPSKKKKNNNRRRRKEEEDQLVPEEAKGADAFIPPGAGSKAVVKYFTQQQGGPSTILSNGYYARSYFFPSKESFNSFISVLNSAKSTIDVCVFAMTDDDVADALIAAKKRNVKVRIITDNQQAAGKGADAERLQTDHGIPYKTDNTTGYMHNKFALVDSATLINGSFNWSKGARFKNRENIIITNIPECIKEFQRQFDSLWAEF